MCVHNTLLFWCCFSCAFFLCCCLFGIAFIVFLYDGKDTFVICFLCCCFISFFVLCVLTLCSHTISKCKQMLCVRTQHVIFIPDI